MEIRPAVETDIPGIVDLLKISLGETLMPKSEDYWRWKHLQNPFGSSPVILSVDSEKIIGVRAFMPWQWMQGEKLYKAVRAVDTATHPEFQGKGIFKKLTLSLLKECEKGGVDFIFNTPNEKSKNGYLKMGWQEAGKLPVRFDIKRPFRVLKSLAGGAASKDVQLEDEQLEHWLNHPDLPRLVQQTTFGKNLVTNVSSAYLNWRYKEVPVVKYHAVGSHSGSELNGLIIGRTKVTRMGMEFRITDAFMSDFKNNKELMGNLRRKMRELNVDYVTLSGTAAPASRSLPGFGMNLPIGPTVTVRSLQETDLTPLQKFKNWSPSLGDLELF